MTGSEFGCDGARFEMVGSEFGCDSEISIAEKMEFI